MLGNKWHIWYMFFKDTHLKYRTYLMNKGWFETFIPSNNKLRAYSWPIPLFLIQQFFISVAKWSANLTFFKRCHWNFTDLLLHIVVYRIDSFWNWSAHASSHGNQFKASGQVSFKYLFALLDNKRHHIPSNFWICCYMRNKLCHLMVIFVMFKWYKLLHYKKILPIYWMTLVL